jgi:hypothetical protein
MWCRDVIDVFALDAIPLMMAGKSGQETQPLILMRGSDRGDGRGQASLSYRMQTWPPSNIKRAQFHGDWNYTISPSDHPPNRALIL